ncbi:DUF317 domain-containing protein [Streptomyces viridochromogenes]|uniref:DUF317 domain-containing protein n=1 Tax=Streptomyces viridochromogenes TaxID=1938 RepID=UPI000AFC5A76|nr:DUF317 domain-containing protein [Streptomyces viridochromogenes]
MTASSPCERITIRHDRAAEGHGPHLVMTARTEKDAPERWRADVAGNAPVEFVASLIRTVASELEADPDHVIYGIGTEPDLIELYVNPNCWNYVEEFGLAGFQSRDGHAAVLGRPPGSSAPPLLGDETIIWQLCAVPDELEPLWDVSFTEKSPPFVVNAVLDQTLSTEPIRRPASQTLLKAVAPLVTARWAPTRPQFSTPPPHPEPPRSPEPKRTPKTR